ncbi:MAG: aminotransferase class V-fold PLP-dependent enzyme, partial [Planctomycetota bacterium]
MTDVKTVTLDPVKIRADFPILNQTIHRQKPLVYLDNGASTQRPTQVIQSMVDCYESTYANVHRGIHYLSEKSSEQYESTRQKIARLVNAEFDNEVIFTSGTTQSINCVARSWGDENVGAGDEILLTLMEHHSNIVPWQQLAERTGAVIRWVGFDSSGRLDVDDLHQKLNEKTKLVGVCAVSNVL